MTRVAAPIMVMVMLLAGRRRGIGSFKLSMRLKILGWTGTCVMAAFTVAMFVTMGH